jgi:uncharacterized damage-inducible protein DinB
MLTDAIRTFHAYDAWANARVLEAAANLDQAQLVAPDDGGYGSVRDTLVHIAAVQWVFLERWQGRSPSSMWDPAAFPDVAAIRDRWVAVEHETAAFVDSLREDDLDTVVTYLNFQGEPWAYPLWQQMLHQANHATQHRSEVAAALTRFGHSPGWLDFLIFIDEQAASTTG